ncbi:hypothetical protein D9758_009154 [Tetrapyrgos nigripes]|uniref:MYND-type domain-containing protein n=1 Tax=Tetrapyrgos nigripes TaxID=182062 RepID=A0A8H5LKB1_9AGAR|nr:hypothetical protein D9758_009154 [Tetrapyrgos nigripes]
MWRAFDRQGVRPTQGKFSPSTAYAHFRRQVPAAESIDPSHPSRDMELILSSLENLTYYINRPHPLPRIRELVEEFTSYFPQIWSWVSVLLKRCVLGDEPTDGEAINYQWRLIDLFPEIVILPSYQKRNAVEISWTSSFLENTSDLFPLIVLVWTYTLEHALPSLETMFRLLDMALVASAKKYRPTLHSRNIAMLTRSTHSIHLVFGYIDTEIRKNPIPTDTDYQPYNLQYALRTVSLLAKSSDNHLNILILSHGTIHFLSRWFRTLVSPRLLLGLTEHPPLTGERIQFLKYIVEIVKIIIQRHREAAMVDFLRGGLIQSIFYSISLLSIDESSSIGRAQGIEQTLAQMFCDIIEKLREMLECAKVLKLFLGSLKRTEESESDTRRNSMDNFMRNVYSCHSCTEQGPNIERLGDLWKKVVQEAHEVQDLRRFFEGMGITVCVNPGCGVNGAPFGKGPDGSIGNIRRLCCARCRVAIYCSRECQIEHWRRYKHGEKCVHYLKSSGYLRDPSTKIDKCFTKMVAESHVRGDRQPQSGIHKNEGYENWWDYLDSDESEKTDEKEI